MTLLSGTIQPPLLTLLSSTSEPSLSPLFTAVSDPDHPTHAFVCTVSDAEGSTSQLRRSSTQHIIADRNPSVFTSTKRTLVGQSSSTKGNAAGPVIHIQSPEPRRTYIQAGRSRKGKERQEGPAFGIELPWVGMQVKRLGRRGMIFEFGVVDSRGREGVIRVSSYKTNPTVHPHRDPPLIHLPLTLPKEDQHTLTSWLDIKLNLASLIPLFKSLPRPQLDPNEARDDSNKRIRRSELPVPSDGFAHVSYARVYANCRVRRIWFSANGERTVDQAGVKDEWALYAVPAYGPTD